MNTRIFQNTISFRGLLLVVVLGSWMHVPAAELTAQRVVAFPPADSPPPPPRRTPERKKASGEDTGFIPNGGPTMRKTQDRTPPPPTNLTVMHKLRYGETLRYVRADGSHVDFYQWRSFRNDSARLMSFTNERLQDGNNYQAVEHDLANPNGFDPLDIPILFMAGDYDFRFTAQEVANLRKYLLDGGTILFNAARGNDDFSRGVVREMARVLPGTQFMRVSDDHPIFNGTQRIREVQLRVQGIPYYRPADVFTIDIGTRAAAILVPAGMGAAWAGESYEPMGTHLVGESAIGLGVNIVGYALSNTEYGRFLAQEFPEYDGRTREGDVFRFALARYQGSWNLNPALQNTIQQAINTSLEIPVDYTPYHIPLDNRELQSFPLVFMTGHYDFQFSEDEISNLRDYLVRGGVLFATTGGGLSPFSIAFQREIRRVFPDGELIPLPPTHPLFVGGWIPVESVSYTPAAMRDNPSLEKPEFTGLFVDNRLAVVFTPYDLFSSANRESNNFAKGVGYPDSLQIILNSVSYVLDN